MTEDSKLRMEARSSKKQDRREVHTQPQSQSASPQSSSSGSKLEKLPVWTGCTSPNVGERWPKDLQNTHAQLQCK
jgi:hypothetical protein